MYIIGLTGGSGCGKSSIGQVFENVGIPVFSADKLYHKITSEASLCCRELESAFGDVLNPDGSLDRKKLFSVVFGHDNSHELIPMLNEITHKYVISAFEEAVSSLKDTAEFVVFDAPLLLECGYHLKCVSVISVLADREVRIARLIQRDGLERDSVIKRLDAQKNDLFYIRASDTVIYNNGDLDGLQKSALRAIRRITSKY